MPLSAGEKLGPYDLQSLLGEGGMGQVWKARDTRLHRTVAVKVSKERFSERFEREARAIASLQDKDGIRLERLPVGGGDPQPIPLPGDLRIPETRLTSSMIGPGGRIVVEIASPAEWAWRVGTTDFTWGENSA